MRFALPPEHRELADLVGDRLTALCPPAAVRAAATDRTGLRARWAELVELGLVGLLAPAEQGGLGLDLLQAVLAVEHAGRVALPGPLVDTALVAVPLLAAGDHPVLPSVLSGSLTVAVRPPACSWAGDGDIADLLLLADGDAHPYALTLYPRASCVTSVEPGVDPACVPVRAEARPGHTSLACWTGRPVRDAFDRGALGTAAFLLGLGQHMLDLAVEYATVREQFGRPIGSFQAVQHHLASAAVALAYARPLVWRAAHSADLSHPDTSIHVSMAKLRAGLAAEQAGRAALQVHGAIGYTTEHDLHLYLKRAWLLARAWGDATFHRQRIADALLEGRDPKEYWDA